jgi:hypothetical protein
VGLTLMLALFCGELSNFMTVRVNPLSSLLSGPCVLTMDVQVDNRLSVDGSIEEELDISLNVTFMRVGCKEVHLDLQVNASCHPLPPPFCVCGLNTVFSLV